MNVFVLSYSEKTFKKGESYCFVFVGHINKDLLIEKQNNNSKSTILEIEVNGSFSQKSDGTVFVKKNNKNIIKTIVVKEPELV